MSRRHTSVDIRLSPQHDKNTGSDREYGHDSAESRKAETDQRYQSRSDEPAAQQEHAEILGRFHVMVPFYK